MAYTSGDILAKVTLYNNSGLVADQVNNDFAIQMDDLAAPDAGEAAAIAGIVEDFYISRDTVESVSIGQLMGSQMSRRHIKVDLTHIVVGTLGSPFYTLDHTSGSDILEGPSSATQLPNEVAATLSYHGDLTSLAEEGTGGTRPRARHRGRVYIGPLNVTAISNATPGPRINLLTRHVLTGKLADMSAALNAIDAHLCVWSRVNVSLDPIVGGFVDDEPDTQRRRGVTATTRTTFTV